MNDNPYAETITAERTALPRFIPGVDPLPAGWSLDVCPGPLGIGYRVDGRFDLHRAPQYARDEAASLGIDLGDDYDPVITRSWAITKDRAVRRARVAVAETHAKPMGEWL